MGSSNRRKNLRAQIAEIMDSREAFVTDTGTKISGTRSRLSARQSVAYGSMMLLAFNPAPVGAIGLGDIHLKSRLGQPLEATVPLTLGAGESLPKNCLQPTFANNTLRSPRDVRVVAPATTGPGRVEVRITTANPLREPMYELSLMVKCTGVSLLVRQYVLMLDLPGMPPQVQTQSPVAAVAADSTTTRVTAGSETPRSAERGPSDPARALAPRTDGIPAGSMYRVSSGDSLSTIARRVNGRLADTTWQVADRIYADNPDAFIRNDPNLIKLGSLVRIPETGTLAAMDPGSRRSTSLAAAARQPIVTAAPATAIDTQREPTPIATSRNQTLTTRKPAELTGEPVRQSLSTADSSGANVPRTPATDGAGSEFADSAAADTTRFNPFADEPPTPAPLEETTAADQPAPTAVLAAPEPQASAGSSNSLLSILIGLLIGALLSLALLRGRLLSALGLRRHAGMAGAVKVTPRPAQKQDAFDESLAAAAFDGTAGDVGDDTPGFPIPGRVEDTYIVEASEAEPTIQDQADDFPTEAAEANKAAAEAAGAVEDTDDSAELAKLFADDYGSGDPTAVDPAAVDPTAEMPRPGGDSTEPTAEMPGFDDDGLGPTAQMPTGRDDSFDPTVDLPAGALDDIFDPTGGVDSQPSSEIDPDLMQAFDEEIDGLDPEEMFATMNEQDQVGDLHGRRATDPLEITINDPLDDPLVEDPTVASELADLPNSEDEDGNLSETLHEALALLERDFEEEFTASQVLERSALEKSLKEDLEQQEGEDTEDDVKRKIS